MRKCKKLKLSFMVAENIIFFSAALCCIAALIYTYFVSCMVTQNIIMSIATTILASVMIPLGLNIGNFLHEKRILNATCKSLINNSIFLVGKLNNHIAPTSTKPFSCYSELKNQKILSVVKFENFETFDELFLLIPQKLNCIIEMNYISKQDTFELMVKKLNASIPDAAHNQNYAQLFCDLTLVIGLIGNIKSPIGTTNYIKRFDAGVQKSYKEMEYVYFKNTDDYIIQCLENDLYEEKSEE